MKAGDIVRFYGPFLEHGEPGPWRFGLLVEYHTWEKIATIMYKEELIRVRAGHVQLHARGNNEPLIS